MDGFAELGVSRFEERMAGSKIFREYGSAGLVTRTDFREFYQVRHTSVDLEVDATAGLETGVTNFAGFGFTFATLSLPPDS
jgi:hypothetical protein